jgi:hypothetical protein
MGTLVALLFLRGLMTPLKLTDTELNIVMRAARPLEVADRDLFLHASAAFVALLPVQSRLRVAGNGQRGP